MRKTHSSANFKPLGEKHSIERFGLIFEFSASITENQLTKIADVLSNNDLITKFFSRVEFKELRNKLNSRASKKSTNKVLKFVKESSKIEWQLFIDHARVIFYCNNYTRWMHVKKTIVEILENIPTVFGKRHLQSLLMGYIDIFYAAGDPDSVVNIKQIFLKDSPFLPQRFLSSSIPLNAQITHGFNRKGTKQTIIESAIIDLESIPETVQFKINTSHQLMFNNYCDCIFNNKKLNTKYCNTIFDLLHNLNKKLLINLLSANTLKQIGIKG